MILKVVPAVRVDLVLLLNDKYYPRIAITLIIMIGRRQAHSIMVPWTRMPQNTPGLSSQHPDRYPVTNLYLDAKQVILFPFNIFQKPLYCDDVMVQICQVRIECF